MSTNVIPAEPKYLVLKEFGGINTQPNRTALPPQDFSWLENFMPIGNAYMPAVSAQQVTALATITGSIATAGVSMHQIQIGTVNYLLTFNTSGACQAVNMASGAITTVAVTATFNSVSVDQWKTERAVIVDTTAGMYSWDGTLFHSPGSLATITVTAAGGSYTAVPAVGFSGGGGSNATATASISGGGVSAVTITAVGSGYTSSPSVTFTGGNGTGVTATASAFIMPSGLNGGACAVWAGRTWIANGRVLTYTAPGTWYDVAAADAAGTTIITEGFLRVAVQAMRAMDNFLYIFGDSSIYIISDLKVTGSITTFSVTNLSSAVGTTFPMSIVPMERAIMFFNKQGCYAAYGASVQKISMALDGIIPLIDFTKPISAGLAQIFNILCYVVSFQYKDPAGARQVQAVFFGEKWFLTSQGNNVVAVAPVVASGALNMFCSSGSDLTQMYANNTAAISTTMQTALQALDNPIFDKQVSRVGIEFNSTNAPIANITIEVDTEFETELFSASASSSFNWKQNNGQSFVWTGTGSTVFPWIITGFQNWNAYADVVGKYLGFTITSTSPQIAINGLLAEYEQRAPWG